jgi:tripartite-type tricarboxylate transporter receptor subunit TctC
MLIRANTAGFCLFAFLEHDHALIPVKVLIAGTPKEVITLLNQEVIKIVTLPDIKERMAVLGFEPVANTPGESAFQIRAEIAKWAKIIRAANIKAE